MKTANKLLKSMNILLLIVVVQFMLSCKVSSTSKGVTIGATVGGAAGALIEGHTDKKASEEYNMELSKQRSQSVASYLEQQSVSSSKITTQGNGELQPISEIDEKKRRVEVALYANKKMKRAANRGQL